MTTATDTVPLKTDRAPAGPKSRFVMAFAAGLVAVLLLGAGALYAFDRQYEGLVLPGVRAGSVDLSGLTPEAARSRLTAVYASASEGELVLTAGVRTVSVAYADVGRRIDVDALVATATGVGRSGSTVDRLV